jgi:hypothetical protein
MINVLTVIKYNLLGSGQQTPKNATTFLCSNALREYNEMINSDQNIGTRVIEERE